VKGAIMKKATLITIGLWLIAGSALAGGVRFEVKGAYFLPESAVFRDVYGHPAKLGLELGIRLARNLWLFTGVDRVQKTGGLTVTNEDTEVRIYPVSFGLRYEIPAGKALLFYLAAGGQEVLFKETSSLGTTKVNDLGITVGAGSLVRVTKAIGLGLFAAWSSCEMKSDGVSFKVGGWDFGGGAEVRF
jgi:hypothetical protein